MSRLASIVRAAMRLPGDLWLGAIQNLPGPLGYRLRFAFWRRRLKHLGEGVRIDEGVYFQNPALISIGDNCWIDRGVMISAGVDGSGRVKKRIGSKAMAQPGEVVIGRNVHLGPYCIVSGIDAGVYIGDDCAFSSGVKVFAFSHHYRFEDRPQDSSCAFGPMVDPARQSMICGPVTLEGNVGVALNAVILPGVFVGRNSFVGANSLLFAKRFRENSMIFGNPATHRGARFDAPGDQGDRA